MHKLQGFLVLLELLVMVKLEVPGRDLSPAWGHLGSVPSCRTTCSLSCSIFQELGQVLSLPKIIMGEMSISFVRKCQMGGKGFSWVTVSVAEVPALLSAGASGASALLGCFQELATWGKSWRAHPERFLKFSHYC